MWTPILLAMTVLVYGIKEQHKVGWLDHRGKFDGEPVFFLGLLPGIFAGTVGFLVAMLIALAAPKAYEPSFDVEIVTLRSSDQVSGQFFVGSGHIGSDLYYFWYQRQDDGGISPRKVVASSRTVIYEESREDARLVVFERRIQGRWWNRFAINVDGVKLVEFHVPIGTVRQGYSL